MTSHPHTAISAIVEPLSCLRCIAFAACFCIDMLLLRTTPSHHTFAPHLRTTPLHHHAVHAVHADALKGTLSWTENFTLGFTVRAPSWLLGARKTWPSSTSSWNEVSIMLVVFNLKKTLPRRYLVNERERERTADGCQSTMPCLLRKGGAVGPLSNSDFSLGGW